MTKKILQKHKNKKQNYWIKKFRIIIINNNMNNVNKYQI